LVDAAKQANFFAGNISWTPSKTSVSLPQILPTGFIASLLGSSLSRGEKWTLFAQFVEAVAQVSYSEH
jgi:hypothetical protein